jgi:hypothetical protein
MLHMQWEESKMRTRVARIVIAALVALAVAVGGSPPTFASSDLSAGTTRTQDPLNLRDTGLATCRLFIGPMDGVPDGQFLLEVNDIHTTAEDDRLELRGTAIRKDGAVFLSTDAAAGADFYQQILRLKIHRPAAEVDLQRLVVTVINESAGDATFLTCSIEMVGAIVGTSDAHGRVVYEFVGPGTTFEGGVVTQQSGAADAAAGGKCSDSPSNYEAPDDSGKKRCDTSDCLVTFSGSDYKWWTHYHKNPYNGGLKTIFAPRNVTVDKDGLHLFAREVDVDGNGQSKWAGAEAVATQNADGSRADFGFGTYLVAARVKTSSSWDGLDKNVAFGIFTFQRENSGDTNNPQRELDLAEISHWGVPPCGGLNPKLCSGNAQFALQLWDKGGSSLPNVDRYTIASSVNEVTLVMIWTGAKTPVTFRQYNGLHDLDTLPAQPKHEWITPSARNDFVPDNGCQQFHLNMWMGNFADQTDGLNAPPATAQEVVVTKFQYQKQ